MQSKHAPRSRRGFTLIELLVVITIIGILAAIALPNYIKAKDKAKEVQVKSAVKSIQIAVERYNTDFEEYPLFLLGGDIEGWRFWHQRFDEGNPSIDAPQNAWVNDPMVKYGYLDAYPNNPFVDNGNSVVQATGMPTGTGGSYKAGDGDPRFGFRGDTMGNGLEYPMVFRRWFNTDTAQSIETERTLSTVTNGDPVSKGFGIPTAGGLHYTMGGRRQKVTTNGQQVITTAFTHWPGNFFYRGFPELPIARKGWTIWFPHVFVKAQTSRYMIGGYGSYTTEGVDAIRLEDRDNTGQAVYYKFAPPWSNQDNIFKTSFNGAAAQQGGLPEIAGGGSDTQGPYVPYTTNPDYPNAFIYGAPDGFKDAVILVVTAGEEVQKY